MSAIYFAIPTDAGQAKIANAIALGIPLKITHMAVGDGNGQPVTPNAAQTALIRENRRAPLNTLFQDPLNQAQLVAEQIIPEDVGNWWIREVGLFSEDGTLIAVANCPDTYKPLLSSGAGRTQVIRIVLVVSDTSAVELKIDPSVVLATRKYVDDVMAAHANSRNHPDASETAKGFTRLATQAQVNETVPANQKDDVVVTVKKLWGWVKQASESVLGMMKVATQGQTDAGTADDVAITPKKLKFGFAIQLSTTAGYIAFPKWLGGLILQWIETVVEPVNTLVVSKEVVFPVSFPSAYLHVGAPNVATGSPGTYGISVSNESKSGATVYVYRQLGSGNVRVRFLAIGY